MAISTKTIEKDVFKINSELEKINKDILKAVQDGNGPRVAELRKQMRDIKHSLKEIRNPKPKEDTPQPTQQTNFELSRMWGDSRMNPYWLRLANYFGVKEKEYHNAGPQLNSILDWAAMELKTNDMSKIIGHVGKTMKKLHYSGYNEKPYAVLYRYVKLSQDHKEAKGDVRRAIEQEKQAYEKDPQEPAPEES